MHRILSSRLCLKLLWIALNVTACSHSPKQLSSNQSAVLPTARIETGYSVATVQYPMEGGKTAQQLVAKVERFVKDAKARGARLVVFPELIGLDAWPTQSKESEQAITERIAREVTPFFFENAERISRQYDIALVTGSSPRKSGSRIRNTAMLVFPDGRKVFHDKVFLTAWEREMGWEAGSDIKVFDAPWGKTSLLICYDIEFPAVAQALVQLNPEVVLVPSMTETGAGLQRVRWTAQARAVELHAYVVVGGTVGKIGNDWIHYGQNLFISPRDSAFPEAPVEGVVGEAGVVMGKLDIEKLRSSRVQSKFIPARDQQARIIRAVDLSK